MKPPEFDYLRVHFISEALAEHGEEGKIREPALTEERVRDVLAGNICRCTGYITIIKGVLEDATAARDDR